MTYHVYPHLNCLRKIVFSIYFSCCCVRIRENTSNTQWESKFLHVVSDSVSHFLALRCTKFSYRSKRWYRYCGIYSTNAAGNDLWYKWVKGSVNIFLLYWHISGCQENRLVPIRRAQFTCAEVIFWIIISINLEDMRMWLRFSASYPWILSIDDENLQSPSTACICRSFLMPVRWLNVRMNCEQIWIPPLCPLSHAVECELDRWRTNQNSPSLYDVVSVFYSVVWFYSHRHT